MRWLSLMILLILMVQPTIKSSYFIWYQLNKAKITQELCQNKDIPSMHCDGKCVLAKKIRQAEQRNQEPAQNIVEIAELDPVTLSSEKSTTDILSRMVQILPDPSKSLYRLDLISEIFHPPSFA